MNEARDNSDRGGQSIPELDFSQLHEEGLEDLTLQEESLENIEILSPGEELMEEWNIKISTESNPRHSELSRNPFFKNKTGERIRRAVAEVENLSEDQPASREELDVELAFGDHDVPSLAKGFIKKHGVDVDTTFNLDEIPTEEGGYEKVEDRVYHDQLSDVLHAALENLSENENFVVVEHNVNDRTMVGIAKDLENISRERVRQIDEVALRKLRHPSRGIISFVSDKGDGPAGRSESANKAKPREDIFPKSSDVPIMDQNDNRPYIQRLEEFCESRAETWIKIQKDSAINKVGSSRPNDLEVIKHGKAAVINELDKLKRLREQATKGLPQLHNPRDPTLVALNTRIEILDNWHEELEEQWEEWINKFGK